MFGLILFVWELLPTTLLVGFFRVHRPPQDLVRISAHFSGPRERAGTWGSWAGVFRQSEWVLESISGNAWPSPQSTRHILNGQVFGSRSYFFDRAGHCEDEACSWENSRGESTR